MVFNFTVKFFIVLSIHIGSLTAVEGIKVFTAGALYTVSHLHLLLRKIRELPVF